MTDAYTPYVPSLPTELANSGTVLTAPRRGRLKPTPEQIAYFETLVNDKGLVLMMITRDFAPYVVGALAGFYPDRAAEIFVLDHGIPLSPEGSAVEVRLDQESDVGAVAAEDGVEIPIEWEELHHLQRIRLARQLVGGVSEAPMTVQQADAIIRVEHDRRRQM
jgi:hypothetical protein